MSSHQMPPSPGIPLPPPPPRPSPTFPSPGYPGGASPLHRRVAVQPPTLTTTALTAQQGQQYLQTPASATSLSTPFSPYASSGYSSIPSSASRASSPMALRGSSSVVAQYNPQEWRRQGHSGAGYMPHPGVPTGSNNMAAPLTGMESTLPSPPPPYSPPTTQSLTQAMGSTPANRSSVYIPPSTAAEYRSLSTSAPSHTAYSNVVGSPVPASAPQFPPPPPSRARDRSASRTRVSAVFSALASRNRSASNDQLAATSAIDALRQNTHEALARAPSQGTHIPAPPTMARSSDASRDQSWETPPHPRAPASRRAASTGGIGMIMEPPRRSTEDESPTGNPAWQPGMPLPPPPPGPPPSGSRSQSLNRATDRSPVSRDNDTVLAAPAPRRPPQHGRALEPIPPTPADWVDDDSISRSRSPSRRGLQLDTRNLNPGTTADDSSVSDPSTSGPHTAHPTSGSSSGLSRTPAKRDPSARGIRERRAQSRGARERREAGEPDSAIESSSNPWSDDQEAAKPADLVLSSSATGALGRRRVATRVAARHSAHFYPPLDAQVGARSVKSYGDLQSPESNHSTPRADSGRRVITPSPFAPTPPFSPGGDAPEPVLRHPGHSPIPPPKTLPTPPPHRLGDELSPASVQSMSSRQSPDRPISHILHTPNEEVPNSAPLEPSRPSSTGRASSPPKAGTQESFGQSAIERHHAFIQKENAARTDQERLELFAEFIVTESRLRRDRYAAAFEAMASDILDLTRDMWRSYAGSGRRSTTPNASTAPTTTTSSTNPWHTHVASTEYSSDAHTAATSPEVSAANYTPRTEPDSPASVTSHGRGTGHTWSGYQPCLSPIPSMAMSTIPDEEDSRGRSASRWWEASVEGSIANGGRKVERSKRESKFMGIVREARENPRWEEDRSPSQGAGTPGPSQPPPYYGPDEYPPEKIGLHEDTTPAATPSSPYYTYSSSVSKAKEPYRLDVSRLVTLPPPYPRHYPAVNNNHPDLSSIRTILRALTDFDESKKTKEDFAANVNTMREREVEDTRLRRSQLHFDIQEKVRAGAMSFAEAAKVEAEFDTIEAQHGQDHVKAEFDSFQKEVYNPLHALFSERITKATASIEHLRSSLFEEARESNPNQAQEGGDEQPELLEKLTLLKWLFETREQLHREMFDLEGERNDRYKSVVLTPYIQSGNQDKIREAEDFFHRDGQDRKVEFEKQVLRRFEDFNNVIEENVTRGVELQLSAFWDIAPGLLDIVQKVPPHLDCFDILVPAQEYDENPSYHAFPLQYLYTLLTHAEKSAYQFIESQINLLCLLHEVKTGVMTTNSRLLETQRYLAGENFADIDREMKAVRADEEERLTVDLKEKVKVVEKQWEEALGGEIRICRERVQEFLGEVGGWDECLDE